LDFGGPEGGPLGGLDEGFDGGPEGGPLAGLLGGLVGGPLGGPLGGVLGGPLGGPLGGAVGGATGGAFGGLVGGAVGGPLGGPDGGALLTFSSAKVVLWAETGNGGGVAAVFGLAGSLAAGARFLENDKISLLGAASFATGGVSITGFGVRGADNISEDFSHGGVLAASSGGASAVSPTEIAVEPPSAFSP